MAIFQPRQRVRILRSRGWPELAGQTGVIIEAADPRYCIHGLGEWIVKPDSWPSIVDAESGYRFGPTSDQIAPLTPPHEAGQWSVIEALMPSLRDMRELA